MSLKKIIGICWLFILLFGFWLPSFFEWVITGSIYRLDGSIEKNDYRFFRSNDPDQHFSYHMNLPLYRTTKRSYTIFPNDCIESLVVNGKQYEWLEWDLCNARWWVYLKDIENYLITWDNEVIVKINQNGWSRSFYIKPGINDPVRMLSFSLLWIGFLLLLYSVFSDYFIFDNQRKKRSFLALFLLMYVVGRIFIVHSEFFQRSFDQTGHLDYFKLLLRWDRNPPSDMCRQCYHPNTYYWFHYYIYKLWVFFHRAESFELIRVYTFFVRRVGIIYAYKLMYRVLYIKGWSYLHFVLWILIFSFWPLQYYFGARISNEVWNHALSYVTIYYWRLAYEAYEKGEEWAILRNTFIWLVLVSIWLLIKSNSFIRWPGSVVWFCMYIFTTGIIPWIKKLRSLRSRLVKTIVVCWIFVTLAVGLAKQKGVHAIIDNMDRINEWNSVAKYSLVTAFTTFSVDQYIHSKDMRNSKDSVEIKSFRWFLSKSMILGEFVPLDPKNNVIIEYLLMASFWIICLFLISLFIFGIRNPFVLVWSIIPIFAMMANRVVNQYGSAMHYRLILPHLVFISLMICISLWHYKYRLRWILYRLSLWIIILFVLLSLYYSIPPYF